MSKPAVAGRFTFQLPCELIARSLILALLGQLALVATSGSYDTSLLCVTAALVMATEPCLT
jgi:hypothetical protein